MAVRTLGKHNHLAVKSQCFLTRDCVGPSPASAGPFCCLEKRRRNTSHDAIAAEIQRHLLSLQALAALGAELRLRQERLGGHPLVQERLREVVRATHPDLVDSLPAEQADVTLASIQFAMRDATDLLEHPTREPGWQYEDPTLIQSIGRALRRMVHEVNAASAGRPRLREALQRPGAFLDVGTGAGWLAIEAARAWPALRVVGIDVWEPSLALARANTAKQGLQTRIELRHQDVATLDDTGAFTLAWLPLMFLPKRLVPVALERVGNALTPGGWLITGRFASAPSALGQALVALRTVRSGGHLWTNQEMDNLLRDARFSPIEHVATAYVELTFAQR